MSLYFDSSAIVKLVRAEAESGALRRHMRRRREARRVTSTLARVEVIRAAFAAGSVAVAQARRQLDRFDQLDLDPLVIDDAATLLAGSALRSLDAIHLASARAIGADLRAVITYDQRMADAAQALGMAVEAPA